MGGQSNTDTCPLQSERSLISQKEIATNLQLGKILTLLIEKRL